MRRATTDDVVRVCFPTRHPPCFPALAREMAHRPGEEELPGERERVTKAATAVEVRGDHFAWIPSTTLVHL
jgi:hypothetical protein